MKDYEIEYIHLCRGETYAYRKAGSGVEKVLLIHGNMSSSVHFQNTMAALEDQYTVYAIDLRGFGNSTYNKSADNIKEYALDVLEFIKVKKLNNLHIVGWSAGGGVAMELCALAYDTNICKDLVLISSMGIEGIKDFQNSSKLSYYTPDFLKRGYRSSPIKESYNLFKQSMGKLEFPKMPLMGNFTSSSINKYAMERIWSMYIYNLNKPPREDYNKYMEATLKQRNLSHIVKAVRNFNIGPKGDNLLNYINIPILILHGDSDLVVSVENAKDTKLAFGEKAQLIILENCGHSPMTDDFENVIEAFRNFWKSNNIIYSY